MIKKISFTFKLAIIVGILFLAKSIFENFSLLNENELSYATEIKTKQDEYNLLNEEFLLNEDRYKKDKKIIELSKLTKQEERALLDKVFGNILDKDLGLFKIGENGVQIRRDEQYKNAYFIKVVLDFQIKLKNIITIDEYKEDLELELSSKKSIKLLDINTDTEKNKAHIVMLILKDVKEVQ